MQPPALHSGDEPEFRNIVVAQVLMTRVTGVASGRSIENTTLDKAPSFRSSGKIISSGGYHDFAR